MQPKNVGQLVSWSAKYHPAKNPITANTVTTKAKTSIIASVLFGMDMLFLSVVGDGVNKHRHLDFSWIYKT